MKNAPHIIFGRPYSQHYDAIVIGAGVGGLFCANLLAHGGMKVLLMERHYMLGGFCSTFRRHGYIFDAATHFYPLLGNPNTLTGKILHRLGIETEWVPMNPVDQFHFPGLPAFAVPGDLAGFIAKLKEFFPAESQRIDLYFKELRQAYLAGLLYYFKGVANETIDRLEKLTMWEKLNDSFRDPRIKAVLMADSLHWGSLPGSTSYVFDAMLRLAYFLGNYYPKGSSQKFADDLGRGLESRGGKVVKCVEAARLLISNGQVHGVVARTVSKKASEEFEFRAPVVISNGDALHTYRDLIGERHCGRAVLEKMESMTPSRACFLMHIGLKGMDPEKLAAVDGYHWTSYDQADALRKAFKIFVPTKFDPTIAPPGCQIIITQKLSHVRIPEVTDWPAHKREVEAFVVGRLREVLPGIENHIVYRSSASAMTSNRFTGNLEGAMLGWEMSPEQLGPGRRPITTPIQNLYMCGHWTQPGGGVTPVIVSAQRAADAVLTGHYDGEEMAAQYFKSARKYYTAETANR